MEAQFDAERTALAERDFAVLAERRRRSGDAATALRIARQGLAVEPARVAGRVAAALALLELDRVEEAKRELEAILPIDPVASASDQDSELAVIGEEELDRAFEGATAESEAMLDADDIAMQAMRAARLDAPEALDLAPPPFREVERERIIRTLESWLDNLRRGEP